MVDGQTGLQAPAFIPSFIFEENTLYFWRVRADNECGEGSWLEALACWHVPVLMLAEPRKDGRFAGIVPASVALARSLHVELLGLVQLGGSWSRSARRADGLPWCGCLQGPDDDLCGLISCLRSRWAQVAREEGPDRA